MLAVAAEVRESEPVLGLLFEAFGAAEVGNFEQCGRSLEGVRRLNNVALTYRSHKSDRLSYQERLSVYHEVPTRGKEIPSTSGERSHSRTNDRQSYSMGASRASYSPRISSSPSPRRGSTTPRTPRRGSDIALDSTENINEYMDSMPRTLSTAASVSHYSLSCGNARSGMIAALRGLDQYRQGVMSMRMFDFFALASCIVAVCQAQVLEPSLVGFNEHGQNAEKILQESLTFLFRFAKMKPCCKVVKKYVRGWNAARKKNTRKSSENHWKKGIQYSEKYGAHLDYSKINISITAMNKLEVSNNEQKRDRRVSVPRPLSNMYDYSYSRESSTSKVSEASQEC
jgi:hypothetical protein